MINRTCRLLGAVLLIILFATSLSSCGGYRQSLCHSNKNVTADCGRWVHLERIYELIEPVFVTQYGSNKQYVLDMPGEWADVPVSVEEYEKYPNRWMYTKEYLQRFGNRSSKAKPPIILGVLQVGTKIRIIRLVERNDILMGKSVDILAYAEGSNFTGYEIDITQLMLDWWEPGAQPCCNPRYLRPWTDRSCASLVQPKREKRLATSTND